MAPNEGLWSFDEDGDDFDADDGLGDGQNAEDDDDLGDVGGWDAEDPDDFDEDGFEGDENQKKADE